jgi:ELWxxDGT repeat protein
MAPQLVLDIGDHQVRGTEQLFLHVDFHVSVDGVAFFFNDDGIHGRELWRSDGTVGGTQMIRDICPGSCGLVSIFGIRQAAPVGDELLFAADDGVHGSELWITDGTAEGTRLLRDLRAGLRWSSPANFTPVASRVFFSADDGIHGRELWVSDGTPEGTERVAEPGLPGIATNLSVAVELGGDLLFAGNGGLSRSDGTAAGTSLIKPLQIEANSTSSNASFQTFGGKLYFTARTDPELGVATLWVSDGTAEGTTEFLAVDYPAYFTSSPSWLFFQAEDAIWRTDGTIAGTTSTALPNGAVWSGAVGQVTAVGEAIVFGAYDDLHGREPWASDGSTAWPLGDLRPGPDSSIPLDGLLNHTFLTLLGDELVFFADDGVHGRELWRSDGTEIGTGRIPGTGGILADAELDRLQALFGPPIVGDSILIRARSTNGARSLWRSAGKPKGNEQIAVLVGQSSAFLPRNEGASIFENQPLEACFVSARDGLIFSAWDSASGNEPWFTSGTPESTYRVADLVEGPSGFVTVCRSHSGRAVLESIGAGSRNLFATTTEIEDRILLPQTSGSAGWLYSWSQFKDALYFTAGGLWRTDGTPEGTVSIEDESELSVPFETAAAGELLYFSGLTLRATTGEPDASVELLGGFGELDFPYPERLTMFGSSLLFFASSPGAGFELWRSGGTPETTTLVRDIRLDSASGICEELYGYGRPFLTRLVVVGDIALFAADDGIHGEELWKTDGTAEGTALVAELFPGSYPSVPRELVRIGDFVYFVAEAPGVGRELWRTDGTPAGTELVIDLVPGPGSSLPEHLTAAGSELYFSAWTPERGREAWRVRHGAEPLVAPLPEIAPGPLSSSPEIFVEIGGAVFTVANDNERGFELWKLREEDVVFSDGFEGTTVEVWSAAVE